MKNFVTRQTHEITALAVKDWLGSKGWMPRSRNAALGLLKTFYSDAIERGYALEHPLKGVKRDRVTDSDVQVFTPAQVALIMAALPVVFGTLDACEQEGAESR